jgi:hypothetical protein
MSLPARSSTVRSVNVRPRSLENAAIGSMSKLPGFGALCQVATTVSWCAAT